MKKATKRVKAAEKALGNTARAAKSSTAKSASKKSVKKAKKAAKKRPRKRAAKQRRSGKAGLALAGTKGCCTLTGSGPDTQIEGITKEDCRNRAIASGKNDHWVAGKCATPSG